ncbi:MAG: alpha/beta hydrolase [Alphaproteobacteria bacterium]|nr:alpha/beta hydrolase [Rhodospirillaceae bacterium]MBT6510981.1 alpha/beta hydrolase [Rhodospirillaceae bacterium]MDG2482235.1 alpha/beta hydrolase [Alphaproteobacteria bacterium]
MSSAMHEEHIAVPHGGGTVNLFYRSWGDADADRTAVCIHGISRNGSDFRWLAEDLASNGWKVVAFDMVGRGGSDWLDEPMGYTVPVYAGHMAHAMKALNLKNVDWIGTSMGGLLGLIMAAMGTSFRSIVLNDVGPFLAGNVVAGILEAVDVAPVFASVEQASSHMQERFAPFGPVTSEQWLELAQGNLRKAEDGSLRLHYDPAIVEPLKALEPADMDLWKLWDGLTMPTLVLRGGVSVVLDAATAQSMTERGPKATLVTEENITHPLWLADAGQIATVRQFLQR